MKKNKMDDKIKTSDIWETQWGKDLEARGVLGDEKKRTKCEHRFWTSSRTRQKKCLKCGEVVV